MSGIGGRVVVPHNVLLVLAAVDDLLRPSLELGLDLIDERDDKWGNDGEDELSKLLLELLNDLGKHRNLLDSGSDALHDIVVELNGRHDLGEDVLDIPGELLGLTRRDRHVLELGVSGVGLDLLGFLALVLVAEKAIRNVVKEFSEHAGISVAALLESAL